MHQTRLFRGLLGAGLAALCLWAAETHAAGAAEASPGAGSWPMFRGSPGLVGVAAGQLPDAPGLQWSFKTEGPVKSSAAIDGGAPRGRDRRSCKGSSCVASAVIG